MPISADMSLDEIIAKNRKSKGGRSVGGFRSDRNDLDAPEEGGDSRARSNWKRGSTSKFSKSVPGGRWTHDKFESEGRRAPRSPRSPQRSTSGGNPNKIVRVLLSNMAPTVTTSDLEELCDPFNFENAVVHFDESGQSLGTGEVMLTRKFAEQMIKELKGISIDGSLVKMVVVDDAAIASVGGIRDRIKFNKGAIHRTQSGGVQKRRDSNPRNSNPRNWSQHDDRSGSSSGGRRGGGGGGGGRGGRQGRDKKVKLSEAELDKQLDEYMSKNKKDEAME